MTTVPLHNPTPNPGYAASDDAARYCPGCGYDLRALSHDRCPECGRAVDPNGHAGLRAPWVQRGRTGAFEAYWRTAALVTFRPGEFAARFDWPRVRHHGSPQFRAWTVACATATTVLAAAALMWHVHASPAGMIVLLGGLAPSAAAFWYGATELAGFFAGPRLPGDTSEEGFRAGIVNDYASAALAWTPLPALAVCAGAAAGRLVGPQAAGPAFVLALLLCAVIAVAWLGDVLVVFAAALDLGPTGVTLAAVFFPVRTAGLAVLSIIFLFVPLACCVGGLVSLRP